MDALAWCRERMLVPGQPLTASLPFAEAGDRDKILALRTLGAELMALSSGTPDPALLNARVGWWQGALAGRAEHPALAAFALAEDRIKPAALFSPLLAVVAQSGPQPRFERFEEFCEHARATGGQVAAAEYRLKAESEQGASAAMEMGAAGWIFRRVRDIVQEARCNRWLLPLDLQAQFQVARQDVLEARGGPGWHGLVRTLVARAVTMGDQASARLGSRQRHLLIHWSVEKRLAAMLVGRPEALLRRRLLPGHAGNVWVAWRTARKLQKQADRPR